MSDEEGKGLHVMKTGKFEVTEFQLKMLAVVTMLVDHIGAAILESDMSRLTGSAAMLDIWLRLIGRLAFPLYCFFIVEGFHYTHDRKKYALRLAVFAAISEVPFDLAFSHTPFNPDDNNVMFTLLIGLLSIWVLEDLFHKAAEKYSERLQLRTFLDTLSIVAVCTAGCGIEYFLNSDYGFEGIFAIILIWLFRQHKLAGFTASVVWLGLTCGESEFLALADLIPMYFYHGKQGRRMKYFFYLFYPAHLLILAMIAHAMNLW